MIRDNENNCKTHLKCWSPWLGNKKIFHSTLPKTALKLHFFYLFLSY